MYENFGGGAKYFIAKSVLHVRIHTCMRLEVLREVKVLTLVFCVITRYGLVGRQLCLRGT
jgi:hypothetical protein